MEDIRKELQDFVSLQEKVLRENDHKRHWSNYSNAHLLSRLRDEVQELKVALLEGKPSSIKMECADVANFAMMIADNNSKSK